MPSNTEISIRQLADLIGSPVAPAIVDVRIDDDFDADPRLVPGSQRRDHRTVADWAAEFSNRRVVVLCQAGLKLSQGTAAWLRHSGADAQSLEGGFEAWRNAGEPLLDRTALTNAGRHGRSVWVTRARPKIDRIACPWLIRRFVDPDALFLFVAASEVVAVAERFAAAPFDVDGVFWSHRGDACTFDTMLIEFGLRTEPLLRLASIVRAADTARLDDVAEASGLLAASLGLSRLFVDDLKQLDAAMVLYDALYLWCRDGTDETHNWPGASKAHEVAA